jgi:hypothetical protein
MAFEAIQPINHVLEVIDELCHASNGSKGFNEKARQKLLNLFDQVKLEKQAKEEQTTRLEQETQEAQKTLAQVYNEYMVIGYYHEKFSVNFRYKLTSPFQMYKSLQRDVFSEFLKKDVMMIANKKLIWFVSAC